MKNNIWKYIRSRPGMPAVVKGVAFESKANVTADYENIKYYFPEPMMRAGHVRRTGGGMSCSNFGGRGLKLPENTAAS